MSRALLGLSLITGMASTLTACSDGANFAPVAQAGVDQIAIPGTTLAFDGSASEDTDGTISVHSWSLVSAPAESTAELQDGDSAFPLFTVDAWGQYTLALRVMDDDDAWSIPDMVEIHATEGADLPPEAVLIATGDVGVGVPLTLDGRGSSDPEGSTLGYAFTLEVAPAGTTAQVEGETTLPTATLTPDLPGLWIFGLSVDDGLQASPRADLILQITGDTNQAPVAICGDDRVVAVGTEVTLNGTGSYDPEGGILSHSWSLAAPDGSSSSLSDPAAPLTSFLADVEGSFVASLEVHDGITGSVAPCTVTITAGKSGNLPPVADAGPDQTLEDPGVPVSLDGTASSDPEGDALAYLWTFDGLPTASTLTSADIYAATFAFAEFTPDVEGVYVLSLAVCDSGSLCDTDQAVITVESSATNTGPTCDAGGDLGGPVATTFVLDGRASTDPDGDPLSYQWVLDGAPGGSTASIGSDTSAVASFSPNVAGDYTISLWVSDGLESCSSTITLVAEPINSPPVCDAGGDLSGTVATTIMLDGTASTDPDGDPLSHKWVLDGAPAGSTATIGSDTSAVASFSPDVAGDYTISLSVSDGLESCSSTITLVAVDPPNSPPLCDAGADQAVLLGDTASLDGSGSSDPDGDPLTYLWTLSSVPSGSLAIISGDTSPTPSFTPDLAGSYTITLDATDGFDACSDSVTLTVTDPNTAPICDAGFDALVEVGTATTLDASGTTDADGDPLTYFWTVLGAPTGSVATPDSPTSISTSFTPDLEGSYTVRMWANDGTEACWDEVTITAEPVPSTAPTCDAGLDQSFTFGDSLTLDGSGSGDVDGDPLTYFWTVSVAPAGSSATLDSPSSVITGFTPDVDGDYTLRLWVSDGTDSCWDEVSLTSGSTTNDPPTCDAGLDQSYSLGDTLTLDGSATSDPDGDPLTHYWLVLSAPAGSAAAPDSPTSTVTTFTPDVAGTYSLRMWSSDGAATCFDDIVLSDPSTNSPPACDAGLDQAVAFGTTVGLDASGSSDPDGDLLTYLWTLTSVPAGGSAVLAGDTTATPSFDPDVEGTWTAQVEVSDGVDMCTDSVSILVTSDNLPPLCDAGGDLSAETGESVTLDGSGSSDPNGDPLSYAWSLTSTPAGASATITGASSAVASLRPDVDGTWEIMLTVDDGSESCTDTVRLTVADINTPPICDAGADHSLVLGDTAALDGSGTTDPDGDPLVYAWVVTSAPGGSSATPDSPTSPTTDLTPDLDGDYTVRLWATDGSDSCWDDAQVSVSSAVNTPPVANAGANVSMCGPELATLDGSGSSDPDGDPLNHSWSFSTLPASSGLTDGDISGASSSTASFTPDQPGTYQLTLVVSDGTDTDSDTVQVLYDPEDALLVLHLDETSGSVASDSGPYGLDGAMTGGSWTGGRFFGGFAMTSAGGEIIVPDADELDLEDDFTISWWMRTDETPGWKNVFRKGTYYNYSVWTYGSTMYFYGYNSDFSYSYATGTMTSDGEWHHYALSAATGTLNLVEDGVTIATGSITGTLRTNTDDLQIGDTSSGYGLDGALDEFIIYDRGLSSAEIRALATSSTQFCTEDEDTTAPTASISSPAGGSTDVAYVAVHGTADDESAIVSLTINGVEAVATSDNFASWSAFVPLSSGSNTLSVTVEDIAGNIRTNADSTTITLSEVGCGDDANLFLTFDESAGGTATDASPNGLDATDRGTGRATAIHGNGATFNGSSNYSTVPDDAALDLSGAFSIEFWYSRDGTTSDWEMLLMKGTTSFNYAFALNGQYLYFGYNTSSGADVGTYALGFNDGVWHHVVGVHDGSQVLLYVDGILEAAETATGTPATNSADLILGSYAGAYYHLNGEIDQLVIWEESLSSADVSALYGGAEACAVSDDHAQGGSTLASSTRSGLYASSRIIDGDTAESSPTDYTMWQASGGAAAWVQVNLGKVVGVTSVRFANTHGGPSYDRATTDYAIEISPTGTFTGEEVVFSSGTLSMETDLRYHVDESSTPVGGQYIRFQADGWDGLGAGLNELQVFGVE